MGSTDNKIILYSSQSEFVVNALERDSICFSKHEYVVKKYGESAPIFVEAYSWFVKEAEKYVPKPDGAEYPYWAFKDLYSVDQSTDSRVLKLCIPTDEAIFFDMYDWNKVLRLKYIGETKYDEERFRQRIEGYGIRRESDIILTNFYPELKREVQDSWQKLFRHHEKINSGETSCVEAVQAGLWQIKKEWVVLNNE